jgi:hypothetical protein
VKNFTPRNSDASYATLNYSSYVILAYKKFDKENPDNNLSEEAYFSHPHMYNLKEAFHAVAERLRTNEQKIFDELNDPVHGQLIGVNEKYASYCEKVKAVEGYLTLEFDIQENDNRGTYDKGVRMNVVSEATTVFFPMDVFLSLNLAIQEFNLTTNSLLLVNSFIGSRRQRSSSSSASRSVSEEE